LTVVVGLGFAVAVAVGVGETNGKPGVTGLDAAGVGFAAASFVPDGAKATGGCVLPGNHGLSGFSRWALLTSEKGCTSTIAIRKQRKMAMTIRMRFTRSNVHLPPWSSSRQPPP